MTAAISPRFGYSAQQIRDAERPLLDAGVPLMRDAAAGLAVELRRQLAARGGTRVVLLAGSGDNGGDGLWAVSELAAEGVTVTVVPTGSGLHEEGWAAARAAGAARSDEVPECDLLVDAIVGIGATGAPGLRGRAHELVSRLLTRPLPPVVAVDVPSGIDPDDGSVPADGVLLRADLTVTFGAVKAGLLLGPARDFAGQLRLIDIGLGPYLVGVEPVVGS